jgi:dUTP pyrophosphatase
MPHGVGIIDQDYCGAEDEIRLQVMNFTTEPVTVARGERLAQGLFVRTERAEFLEVADLGQETRGGFGSTGH